MTNPFMELIGSGEGNYNSYNRGTRKKNGKDDIIPSIEKHDFSQWGDVVATAGGELWAVDDTIG